MEPALSDGDIVVMQGEVPDPAGPRLPLAVGDVVVARHPFRSDVLLIKRIVAIDGDRYDLRGDNPRASTDSRTLGLVPRARILGKVVVPDLSEG